MPGADDAPLAAAVQDPASDTLAHPLVPEAGPAEPLAPLLYRELREITRRLMSPERAGDPLRPAPLVREACLGLPRRTGRAWEDPGRLLRAAARAMRAVLVDQARERRALLRGGAAPRLELEDVLQVYDGGGIDILALDEALNRFVRADEGLARIVELRLFSGLTVPETARALGLPLRRIERGCALARFWLYHELEPAGRGREPGVGETAGAGPPDRWAVPPVPGHACP